MSAVSRQNRMIQFVAVPLTVPTGGVNAATAQWEIVLGEASQQTSSYTFLELVHVKALIVSFPAVQPSFPYHSCTNPSETCLFSPAVVEYDNLDSVKQLFNYSF